MNLNHFSPDIFSMGNLFPIAGFSADTFLLSSSASPVIAEFLFHQIHSFFIFFGFGITAAAVFDLMRLFRRTIPHTYFFTSLEDVFFVIAAGVILIRLLFRFQSGQLRFFSALALFPGIFLWKFTFGKLLLGPVCHFLLSLRKALKKACSKLFHIRKKSK